MVGTSILDYSDLGQREQIIEAAHQILEETAKLSPAGKLLQLPPHDSPLNSAGYLLAMALHKQWTKHLNLQKLEVRAPQLQAMGLRNVISTGLERFSKRRAL